MPFDLNESVTFASCMLKPFIHCMFTGGPPEPEHTTTIEKVTVDVLRRLTSHAIIIATAQNIHNWLIEV